NGEASHPPPASKAVAEQVKAKAQQIEQLSPQLAALPTAERTAVEEQIKKLEAEKSALRRSELQAIEWKPLWGKPAIFAGAILLMFIVLFRPPEKKQPAPVAEAALAA